MIKNLGAENIRIRGAIFCQERRMALWNQLINSIAWGNQKWVGAIPAFTPKAREIKLLKESKELREENFNEKSPVKMITNEAKACVRKYLIEASEDEGEGENIKMGIKAIRFISNPNQATNQDDEETETPVLNIKIKISLRW